MSDERKGGTVDVPDPTPDMVHYVERLQLSVAHTMSPELVRYAASWCRQRLRERGYFTLGRLNDPALSHLMTLGGSPPGRMTPHLHWMLDQVERVMDLNDQAEREKAMRWLGFVQGALWVLGFATIDEMRDANRPVTKFVTNSTP